MVIVRINALTEVARHMWNTSTDADVVGSDASIPDADVSCKDVPPNSEIARHRCIAPDANATHGARAPVLRSRLESLRQPHVIRGRSPSEAGPEGAPSQNVGQTVTLQVPADALDDCRLAHHFA